jgi:hypothetical protein
MDAGIDACPRREPTPLIRFRKTKYPTREAMRQEINKPIKHLDLVEQRLNPS